MAAVGGLAAWAARRAKRSGGRRAGGVFNAVEYPSIFFDVLWRSPEHPTRAFGRCCLIVLFSTREVITAMHDQTRRRAKTIDLYRMHKDVGIP